MTEPDETKVNTMTEDLNENAISSVENEFLEINKKNEWHSHYMSMRSDCSCFTSEESKKPQNRVLNRYRDVSPYDHSRIILKRGPCDYINANLLKIEKADRQYILTQGPLPHTAGHFWLMVWEQKSKAVLMLNRIIEKNQIKCHQYWPLEGSSCDTMMFPEVNIKVEFVNKTDKHEYVIRTLRLTDLDSNESRDILHFHYTMWPDFGVPQSPTGFLRFLVDVRRSGALDQNVGPLVVHCSAGIGRTGTFCLVDTCLVLIEKNGLDNVNVKDILLEMRKSRMGLIQTPDQLRFSYTAVIQGAKQLPSNNNFDNDEINHYDEVTNSSIDEEDEPPPLPPPRGESLARSNKKVDPTPPSSDTESESNEGLPDKPLPNEPSSNINNLSSNNSVHKNNLHDQNNEDEIIDDLPSSPNSESAQSQLRQRHLEKKNRLATKLREMKRRQKQSEEWQRLKRSLFSPLSLGVGAAIAGGGVLAICGYLYLRG